MGLILRTRSWQIADILHMLSNTKTSVVYLRKKENAAKWSEWFSNKLRKQLKIQIMTQIKLKFPRKKRKNKK